MDIKRIKKYRKEKGYTLAYLSEKTGYTPSHLSQLERGIKQPSLEALRKIGDCLDIPIFDLLSDDNTSDISNNQQVKNNNNMCVVIYKNNRKKAMMPEILTEYEFVTPYSQGGENGPEVIGLCTSLKPGCWTCEKKISHNFDESTYIIKGNARAYIADEIYELEEGDSIYIYANVPHNFLNCGNSELVMVGYTSKRSL